MLSIHFQICGTYFTSEQASVKYRTLLIRYKKYVNFIQHKGAKGMQRPKFYNEMDRLKLVSQSLTMPSTVEVERAEVKLDANVSEGVSFLVNLLMCMSCIKYYTSRCLRPT